MKKIFALLMAATLSVSATGTALAATKTAALYGAEETHVDCTIDVSKFKSCFNAMDYSVEPFTTPTTADIKDWYDSAAVLMYAGHGQYDRVVITPYGEDYCTGVYKSTSDKSVAKGTLVGIGKNGLDNCQLAIFAACLTANTNEGTTITQYAVNKGAEAAIGWKNSVGTDQLQDWEHFFCTYLKTGDYTLKECKEFADALVVDSSGDVLTGKIYGDSSMILSSSASRSIAADDFFTYIDEEIYVNCVNEDFAELTEYLEQNVEGFDKESCKIELVHNYADNDYEVMYVKEENGFKTPYKVMVFISEDGVMKYFSNLPAESTAYTLRSNTDVGIDEADIDEAKKEATVGYEDYEIVEQTVEKQLNSDMQPVLRVFTIYEDVNGAKFAENYDYALI